MGTSLSRGNLPEEFFDTTSRQLLLQPEPQFLHGRLIMTAISMDLDTRSAALGIPGHDLPDPRGAYMNYEQNQFPLEQKPFYTDAFKVDTSFLLGQGAQPGHTIRFNRPRFADTTYTFASREVPTGSIISTTPINVSSEQVPLTIKRYAGPFDSLTGRPAPIAVSRFDNQRSIHSLDLVREMHLMRDFHKTIDTFGVTLFDTVDPANIVYPAGMTTDNDSTIQGDFPFSYAVLRSMEQRHDDIGTPLYPNGRRMLILTPLQANQLSRDAEYQRLRQFDIVKSPVTVGSYVASIGRVDIFQSATLTKKVNINGVTVHYAQMVAPGFAGIAPGERPVVKANSQDNYGEDPMVIWLFYCAFGVLDARFGVSARTT